MIYYTETNYIDHDSLRTAGAKGRDDYFEVLRRSGFECIRIPTLKKKTSSNAADRLILERRLRRAWEKSLSIAGEGDILILHSPVSEKFLGYADVIRSAKKRGCRIINIVFDLETFFHSDYRRAARIKHELDRRMEAAIFRLSDMIICHNERMKERLTGIGVPAGRIVCVGVMDYLRDGEPGGACGGNAEPRFSLDKPVVFCSNLDRGKSGFAYRLTELNSEIRKRRNGPDRPKCSGSRVCGSLCVDLYGPGYDGEVSDEIRYRGVYPSDELMDIMEGSFGLVWDGGSVDTCKGACGEYLRYNNPHKLSHYLAGGMPVLIWEEAALADYVIREGCGLAIKRLSDIPGLLAGLTGEEYERMRENAVRAGRSMRCGEHIRAASERAVSMLAAETLPRCSEDSGKRARDNKHSGIRIRDNRHSKGRALIIFSREPEPGRTKTRLMPYFTPEECAGLHRCMIRDTARAARGTGADIFVTHTGAEPVFLKEVFGSRRGRRQAGKPASFFPQHGEDIGERMKRAFSLVLGQGYDKVILIGTDIPEISAEILSEAYDLLDTSDVVIGPTSDGGYYLIGMKGEHPEAFSHKLYSVSTVCEETAASIREAGHEAALCTELSDIDTPDDVREYRSRIRNVNSGGRCRGVCSDWAAYRVRACNMSTGVLHLGRAAAGTCTGRFLSEAATISVIVPVYNEEGTVGVLMDQLEPYADELEVIFVDGGSTDETASMIRSRTERIQSRDRDSAAAADRQTGTGDDLKIAPVSRDRGDSRGQDGGKHTFTSGFRLITAGKGRGLQLNRGAEEAGGDILFFLHCDSILPDDFAQEIRRVMAGSEWGSMGVRFGSRNIFMLTNRIISNHRAAVRRLPFGDQGIFISRETFFKAGMFPEIPVMEDYEFSMRLRRLGLKPGFARHRILTSGRRYGSGTLDILKTEAWMIRLRLMYRMGVSPEEIARLYTDIR